MKYQLKKQLKQTINVASMSSVDVNGDVTFGSPSPMLARVVLKEKEVNTNAGVEIRTVHLIVTEGEIKKEDRLWLPGDATTGDLARKPIEVIKAIDKDGAVDYYLTTV